MVSISAEPSASPIYKPSATRSWTTITSIRTETIHPTLLFTLTESELISSIVTSSAFGQAAQTSLPALDTNPVVGTPSPTTINTSTSFPGSSLAMTSTMDAPLSMMEPFAPLSNLSDFASWENPPSTSTNFGQPEVTTSSTSSVSTSTTKVVTSSAVTSVSPTISPFVGTVTGTISADNSTSSITAPFIGTVTSTISADNSTTSSKSTPVSHSKHDNANKPAVIIGSILGASAFIMFAIAAWFVLRRRRQKIIKVQKIIGARNGGDSFNPEEGYETLYFPEAPVPGADTKSAQIPTLPVIPEEVHSVPAYSNGPFITAHSNPDLSMDSLYLRSERSRRAFYTQNTVTSDHETDHSPSLAKDVSPRSHVVSTYSRSSWEDASVSNLDFYGDSTTALPQELVGVTLPPSNSKYLEACMSRDSLRSDPFDLEAPSVSNPPGSPPVPPVPTEWGTKF